MRQAKSSIELQGTREKWRMHERARAVAESGYRRGKDLAGLLKLWPHEVERLGPADQAMIVRRILRALRAERRRGQAGHWTYDLTRHKRLVEAYNAEHALLAGLRKDRPVGTARASAHAPAPI
jgi:hypothetical protein